MLARDGSTAGGGSWPDLQPARLPTLGRHFRNMTTPTSAQPGGLWINLGPLLYHWAEPNELPNEPNVELPLEDVLDVAQRLGFVLEEHETVEAPFTSDCRWAAVCTGAVTLPVLGSALATAAEIRRETMPNLSLAAAGECIRRCISVRFGPCGGRREPAVGYASGAQLSAHQAGDKIAAP